LVMGSRPMGHDPASHGHDPGVTTWGHRVIFGGHEVTALGHGVTTRGSRPEGHDPGVTTRRHMVMTRGSRPSGWWVDERRRSWGLTLRGDTDVRRALSAVDRGGMPNAVSSTQ